MDWELLYDVLDRADPDILIEGEARGADKWSRNWAESRGFKRAPRIFEKKSFIPVPADWTRYGKAAGPIRNKEMADLLVFYRDDWNCEIEVYAFHNDIENSKGTKNMIEQLQKLGIFATLIVSLKETDANVV